MHGAPYRSIVTSGTSSTGKDPVAESDAILLALRRILRRVSLHSKQLGRATGLTTPQTVCLRILATAAAPNTKGSLTVAQLSARARLSPATVTGILDRLARRGLVHRERDARDRRRVLNRLTQAGSEKVETLPVPLQDSFVRGFEALPGEERAQLIQSLERIVELMEADELDAAPVLDVQPSLSDG